MPSMPPPRLERVAHDPGAVREYGEAGTRAQFAELVTLLQKGLRQPQGARRGLELAGRTGRKEGRKEGRCV